MNTAARVATHLFVSFMHMLRPSMMSLFLAISINTLASTGSCIAQAATQEPTRTEAQQIMQTPQTNHPSTAPATSAAHPQPPTWLATDEARNLAAYLSPVLTCIAAMIAASIAYISLRDNNRAKHVEIAMKIEEGYRTILPTLLKCENLPDYDKEILPALVKTLASRYRRELGHDPSASDIYNDAERKTIVALDAALRHFFFVHTILQHNPMLASLRSLHSYYVGLLRGTDPKRADLAAYISTYWAPLLQFDTLNCQTEPVGGFANYSSDPKGEAVADKLRKITQDLRAELAEREATKPR